MSYCRTKTSLDNKEEKIPSQAQSTLTIASALSYKMKRLEGLNKALNKEFDPIVSQETKPFKIIGTGLSVGLIFLSSTLGYILRRIFNPEPYSTGELLILFPAISILFLLTLWVCFAPSRAHAYRIRNNPDFLPHLNEKTTAEIKATLELHNIINETPEDYFDAVYNEKVVISHELKEYDKRANQRLAFLCSNKQYLPPVNKETLSHLLTPCFEFAEMDYLPCTGRDKLKNLLALIAKNDYEKQVHLNFFRRLAPDPERKIIFNERRIVCKILGYLP